MSSFVQAENERAPSTSSRSQHLNPFGAHDADVPGPRPVRLNECTHERHKILRRGGVHSEQNDAGLFNRLPALNGNLPEVLIQSHHDTSLGFGSVQEGQVFPSSAIAASPEDVVAIGSKRFDQRPRKVLVR
jgi:hypothetical protein